MDENKMGWREYARYAEMSVEELARDCEVQVFRATGPGEQGVNTTDSAVRMKHGPTGITVTARESRSQFQNRASCLRKLRAELERRGCPPRRRVKTKVPQRSRQRRLNDKHFNAIKKANRRKPGSDEWPPLSCGEIGTVYAAKAARQSLFHRNLGEVSGWGARRGGLR